MASINGFQYMRDIERNRNDERASRMAQVAEQFATRLTMRRIKCRVSPSGSAPAWSTSNTISFNRQSLGDLLDPRIVGATKGLTLHEVSHILFTPRSGSELVRFVLLNKIGRAFNALEDQRIETLMAGRFGQPVIDWFQLMVAEHLVKDLQSLQLLFPLVHGRRYLPLELRRLVRSMYANQDSVAELASIIDEYRLLVFPEDTERAKELILRYSELVKELPQHGGHPDRAGDEHESTPTSKPMGRPAQKQAQKNAQERDEEVDDLQSDTNNADESDSTGQESPSSSSEPQPESDDEFDFGDGNDWEDEDDEQDSDEDSSDESDSDSSSSNETDGSSGASDSAESTAKDMLEQLIEDTLEQLDEQIADDIKRFNGELELEGEQVQAPAQASFSLQSVDATAMRASKSFGQELEQLRVELEPAWERKTASGRINAQRYMTGADLDEVFDRWTDGNEDAVDIEAVILLDVSGSMSSHIRNAYQSMWAIKHALDRIQANCTVMTFDSYSKTLYNRDEEAEGRMRFSKEWGGGTNPLQALRYSTRLLADSDRKVKMLFAITDGDWGSQAQASDEFIKRMRDAGVLTALAFIGNGQTDTHNCEVFSRVNSSAELFQLGRLLVRVATQRNITK